MREIDFSSGWRGGLVWFGRVKGKGLTGLSDWHPNEDAWPGQ